MIAARCHAPRGSALITTMWILIAITGVTLVLSKSMRVEALASANRLSQLQAEQTERGAEQFLCSVVDAEVATPGSTVDVSMEGRQLGAGYFWVLKPDPNNEQNRAYGLTDEAGKIDLNTATLSMLQMLPNMPPEVASSIYNWRGTAQSGDGLGAADQDYEALPDPYLCKHSPFETTDELTLIKGVDGALLFGSDRNRDGWVDPQELASGGPAASINSGNSSARGIYPYVTAYGVRATNATTTGTTLVDVNSASETRIRNVLQSNGVSNTPAIMSQMFQRGVRVRSYRNIFDWAVGVQIQATDLSKVFSKLTANPVGPAASRVAKVNVNDAPEQVLMCLPSMEQSDADAIISYRQLNTSADPTNISWMMNVIARNKLTAIGSYVTGRSTCFSADIVAVSPDGRAFRRYRVVIDGSKTPAYVIYRRELTGYGWPLSQDIQDAMRAGKPPPDANAAASNSNSPLGQGM